jgi:hypothetical protein
MQNIEVRSGSHLQLKMEPEDEVEVHILKSMAEKAQNGQKVDISYDGKSFVLSVKR